MLKGVRVVQLASLLPGPLCGRLLSSLGAEVTVVEPAPKGDPLRALDGPLEPISGPMFAALNRGKRSVVVDLKLEADRALVDKMAGDADVFIWSVRPGSLAAAGFEPGDLRRRHPNLIVAAITGYGLDGPLRRRAGHDLNYLARAGVLGMMSQDSWDVEGRAGDGQRTTATRVVNAGPLPVQVADVAGGAYPAAMQILACLYYREKQLRAPTQGVGMDGLPGHGCVIDVSMSECSASMLLLSEAARVAAKDIIDLSNGNFPLCGGAPCYQLYPTKDRRLLAIGALEPPYWRRAVRALGLEPQEYFVKTRVQYATGTVRDEVMARIAAQTRLKTLAEWTDIFDRVDAMVDPVLLPSEAAASAHTQARLRPLASHGHRWDNATMLPFRIIQPSTHGPSAAEGSDVCAAVVDLATASLPSAAQETAPHVESPQLGEHQSSPFHRSHL
jgi:alpha-methylacyl-CoA racemase